MVLRPTATSRKLVLLGGAVFLTIILFYFSSSFNAYFAPERLPAFGAKTGLDGAKEGSKVEFGDGEGFGVSDGSGDGDGKVSLGLGVGSAGLPTSREAITPPDRSMTTPTAMPMDPDYQTTVSVNKPSRTPYEAIISKIQDLRKSWTPPGHIPGHWPPYEWYSSHDYDPNRWEGFEWDNDYYINNGVRQFRGAEAKPTPYLPYPKYNSREWRNQWKGQYMSCKGPRGKPVDSNVDDMLHAYPQLPERFPDPAVGDAAVVGLDVEHCFDRYNRYGSYGYGQNSKKTLFGWKQPSHEPDWSSVRWGHLQNECLKSNKDRYMPNARLPPRLATGKDLPESASFLPSDEKGWSGEQQYHSRTAVLIRSWEGYEYTPNDLEAIRALITETSLLSGGEYQVYLLVNIKNSTTDIWNDTSLYDRLLNIHVPAELQSIAILWNEKVFQEWYPHIGDWQVYWHQFMPLQWFSKMHPEFDFVWNWETDARYTGNHYHFLEKVAGFSKKVPRKHLWERNSRFYFPSAHGTYEEWLNDTDTLIDEATREGTLTPVWGPQPYNTTQQKPIGPKPPRSERKDHFEWGVGEDADLITLQPIWDPAGTWWSFRDKIFNFSPGLRPDFTRQGDPLDEDFHPPEYANIPRRTYINTVSRFSRRQLHAMHLENQAGRSMQAEMWPATVALQHGLKAVYAPHPIWVDRKWPAWYMDAIFNADGGVKANWGARGDSVYNQDREHNFNGWSWYYDSTFPKTLYRRWLGWKATVGSEEQFPNNPLRELGGRRYEEKGVQVSIPPKTPDSSQAAPPGGQSFGGREITVGGQGRMCLPGMLLHPVKHVYAGAQEGVEDEDDSYEGVHRSWLSKLFGDGF